MMISTLLYPLKFLSLPWIIFHLDSFLPPFTLVNPPFYQMYMLIDQNHLLFNNSPTTHLLTLARSKRLEAANHRKDQTSGQSRCHAIQMIFAQNCCQSSVSPLATYIVIVFHQDMLYYVQTNLEVIV